MVNALEAVVIRLSVLDCQSHEAVIDDKVWVLVSVGEQIPKGVE